MSGTDEPMIDYEARVGRLIDRLEQWIVAYDKAGDHRTAAVIYNILTSTKGIFGRQ